MLVTRGQQQQQQQHAPRLKHLEEDAYAAAQEEEEEEKDVALAARCRWRRRKEFLHSRSFSLSRSSLARLYNRTFIISYVQYIVSNPVDRPGHTTDTISHPAGCTIMYVY